MSGSRFVDVRMKGFGPRAVVSDVLALLNARVAPLEAEAVPLLEAAGRVLAEAVVSTVDVPGFERSAMDGYAVRASDTREAHAAHPVTLKVAGEAFPARPFTSEVRAGEAVRVTTGAPLPTGADSVLMA